MVLSPSSTTVLWDMVDGPMPRGLLGVGDPDVHVIEGVPTMFLGGFSTSFRNRLYRAVLPAGADPGSGQWRIDTGERGRVRALAADPPRDAWDGAGMHTPSYVPPTGTQPARIYYTGRGSREHYGPGSRYAIGVLELLDGRWRRRDAPLIEGIAPRQSVLEPLAVTERGRYVMWFQANPHEVGPGDLPDYELRVVESADGVTWSVPRVFATSAEGYFDNAVARVDDGWLMLLARGANLHNTPDFPPQGLWLSRARRLSADRADWTEPVRFLDTDAPGTAAWMARGTYGPTMLSADDGVPLVFVTGARDTPRWPVFTVKRLLRARKPVVPAPFYLATGSIQLPGMVDRAVGGAAFDANVQGPRGVDTATVSRKAEDRSGTIRRERKRGATMAEDDRAHQGIGKDFDEAVNMTAGELSDWLESEESQSVGQSDGGESVGHRAGRRIVEILQKNPEHTDADLEHMRKVVGYVHRHLAQRPEGDVTGTRWRYSLMNWGHDPLKD